MVNSIALGHKSSGTSFSSSQTPRGKTRQLGKEQFGEVRGFIKVQVQNKKHFPSFLWTEIQLWQHCIPISSHHHLRRNLDLERQK